MANGRNWWTTGLPTSVFVVLVPIAALLLGVAIRYAAVVSVRWDQSAAAYLHALCVWDCGWYVAIAETGYNPFPNLPAMIDHGNWAFFPLAPLVFGAMTRLLPFIDTVVVASITSLALATAAVVAAWPLFDGSRRSYILFAVLILCGPFSVYFSTALSEALFLFLTVAVLAELKGGSLVRAGLLAACLSATRIVGVFMVLVLAYDAWRRHREQGGTLRAFPLAVLGRPELVLALLLAPLGLFSYMAFLHFWIGDALAFSHVQRAWAREIDNPVFYLWTALTRFPDPGGSEGIGSEQYLAVAALTGFALTGVLFIQRRFGEAVFCLVCLGLPLFTGVASMIRFIAALAPLNLLAARLFSRNTPMLISSILLCLYFDFTMTIAWIEGKVALV